MKRTIRERGEAGNAHVHADRAVRFGMGEDIAVLAMAADDFPYLEAAKDEVGAPGRWVPRYKELRRAARHERAARHGPPV